MLRSRNLQSSRKLLLRITDRAYNKKIAPIAKATWQKHLQIDNPLWSHVNAKTFAFEQEGEMAHVIAMIDKRLPKLGLIGYFGATNMAAGILVLKQATDWLASHGVNDAYGPINGTITSDYRFNISDDYKIPGEPVNPTWYIDIFRQAGFTTYNQYVSGFARFAQLYARLFTRNKAAPGYEHITLQPFNPAKAKQNLATYHKLMNAIFPANSIYCPVITLKERIYNMTSSTPLDQIFAPNYCYFAYDGREAIGFIVAYPHNGKLVLKTIGLLPEYRGKRISDLLVRRVHDQAKKDGLKGAVYATIRVGNAVHRTKRPGVSIYRHYITMHKSL